MRHRRTETQRTSPPETTIKQVAQASGLSTATVSRVLSGNDVGSPEARQRVLKAVKALDYQPNRMARGLRARQRKVIGVIIPDLQNPFFTGVVHGIEEVLWREGFTLLLAHSNGAADREQQQIGILRGEGAAGLILIPGNAPDADYATLATAQIPMVAVDRAPTGLVVDLIKITNREGTREAAAHLAGLGYRDLALINGPAGFDVSRERFNGFQDALQAAGLPQQAEYVVQGDFHQESGYTAMRQLLDLPRPPRAVVIANNLMTLGALQAIHERGVQIPEMLAVVCFDDMPWAISLRPPLTAIAQPAEELGRAAAQLLLERLKEPGRPVRQVVFPTRLVIRASCGTPPQQSCEKPAEIQTF